MKISENAICVPPYLSTSWDNVLSLQVGKDDSDDPILIVNLVEGISVKIPKLNKKVIDTIFAIHMRYIEKKEINKEDNVCKIHMQLQKNFINSLMQPSLSFNGSLFFEDQEGESLAAMMQHNPEQTNSPVLPQEILRKVFMLAFKFKGDLTFAPLYYKGCNCVYCQLAKAINYGLNASDENDIEEEISDDDLKFREWDVFPIGDKVYEVVNIINPFEEYIVNLNFPIACSCGEEKCEHMKIVLLS